MRQNAGGCEFPLPRASPPQCHDFHSITLLSTIAEWINNPAFPVDSLPPPDSWFNWPGDNWQASMENWLGSGGHVKGRNKPGSLTSHNWRDVPSTVSASLQHPYCLSCGLLPQPPNWYTLPVVLSPVILRVPASISFLKYKLIKSCVCWKHSDTPCCSERLSCTSMCSPLQAHLWLHLPSLRSCHTDLSAVPGTFPRRKECWVFFLGTLLFCDGSCK